MRIILANKLNINNTHKAIETIYYALTLNRKRIVEMWTRVAVVTFNRKIAKSANN